VLLSIIKEPPVDPLPQGVKAPGMGPRKTANSANDLRHWAELCGAEFSPDARKSRPDPGLLTAAALVAKDEGRFREYHYPAFRARWAEARDISDTQVVRGLLAGAGLDADSALERAQSGELRKRVEEESRQAIERGVFGAPTLFVGDEMFWGNDRFELVRYYVQKASGS
jgi:2-hydroxychromene-2-carboxylate isomerase